MDITYKLVSSYGVQKDIRLPTPQEPRKPSEKSDQNSTNIIKCYNVATKKTRFETQQHSSECMRFIDSLRKDNILHRDVQKCESLALHHSVQVSMTHELKGIPGFA